MPQRWAFQTCLPCRLSTPVPGGSKRLPRVDPGCAECFLTLKVLSIWDVL